MAQALSDIYNSLNAGGYDQSRAAINGQMAALPAQYQAQEQGLDQQKTNAFTGITNQANNNGMFYSGAPVSEEQTYTGGTYLPALANLKAQQSQQTYGLQQALAGVNQAQTGAAQGILQNQTQNDQQNNYYNQMLQQNAQYNQRMAGMYGGGGSSGGGSASPYGMSQDNSGGMQFSMNGKPITMAQYAAGNGTSVNNILQQMNTPGAKSLLQQMSSAKTAAQQNALKQKYSYVFGGV